ncbi:MAG: hypothetical protein WCG26_06740 [Chloroflexales bacterium]
MDEATVRRIVREELGKVRDALNGKAAERVDAPAAALIAEVRNVVHADLAQAIDRLITAPSMRPEEPPKP